MATRKRTLQKTKSSNIEGKKTTSATGIKSNAHSTNTGSGTCKSAISDIDVSLYLKWFFLVLFFLVIVGFLLYPDIVNVVKAVHKTTQETDHNVEFSKAHRQQESDGLQHTSNEELPLSSAVVDGDADVIYLTVKSDEVIITEEQDENLKPSRISGVETTAKTKTRIQNTTNRIPEGEAVNVGEHATNKQSKDNRSASKANSKQDQKTVLHKNGDVRKRHPIILNGENSQIVLDSSQIKFADSLSGESLHQIADEEKETTNTKLNLKTKNKQRDDDSSVNNGHSKKNIDKVKRTKSSQEIKIENSSVNKDKTTHTKPDAGSKGKQARSDRNKTTGTDVLEEAKNFNATFQKTFTPKKIFADGRRIPPSELLHQKDSNSSVRVFLFDDFLSTKECDGLIRAHDSHVKALDKPPILCFDSIGTLRKHISEVKKIINVTPNDFTKGTKCVNASFSLQLQSWMKSNWSYSTAFYPGESTFSKVVTYRIKEAMGLDPASGGKFQITSYPEGKAYKEHTDCTLGGSDKRDRVVSVLMYLSDVEDGGETTFPDLGIWVRPKKGRAIVWNNMSPDGVCEEHSKHIASVVRKGSKYILIRWYYYKTFYSLGRRPTPPHLPERDPGQPMVHCDEYNSGSCRWYDEWSYEPLLEYEKNKLKLI